MKMFVNFCESTSMHGWIFFGSANAPLKQRLFWLVVLSASLVTAAVLIFLNTAAFIGVTVTFVMLLIVASIVIIFLWLRIRTLTRKNLL